MATACSTGLKNILQKSYDNLGSYSKRKCEKERDKRIVSVYRTWQAIIIIYIFGYNLLYEKGYQKVKHGDMHTTIKLKGVIVTSEDDLVNGSNDITDMYHRVWDSSEYGGSLSENSESFFVATNVIITPNQTMGKCDEDPEVESAICNVDEDCSTSAGKNYLEHGKKTGKCISSEIEQGRRVCEIHAWCPVEREKFPTHSNRSLLEAAENFTVFIKSEVNFHYFGEYKRNNIKINPGKDFLKTCFYDKEKEPFCPIFTIKNLMEMAKDNFHNTCHLGGVFVINVKWDCDLDWDFKKNCKPKYKVRRIDKYQGNLSKGYSFRKAYHYDLNRRCLVKYHGMKFVIEGTAVGRKFSLLETITNFAIGLALLRTANHVANFATWVKKMAGNKNPINTEIPESREMTISRTEVPP